MLTHMRKITMVAATLLLATSQAHAAPDIGNLKNYAPAANSTCGLFLNNSHGELALYADTSFDAFANVDGKVVKVHHVKTENHQVQPGRVESGDTFKSVFATEGTQVTLDLTVVKGCETTGSVCPAVTEKGKLEIQNANGTTHLDVTGGEHCSDRH